MTQRRTMFIQIVVTVNFIATYLQIGIAIPTSSFGAKQIPNSYELYDNTETQEPLSHLVEAVNSYQKKLVQSQLGSHNDPKNENREFQKRDSFNNFNHKMDPTHIIYPSDMDAKPNRKQSLASQPLGSFMDGLPYTPHQPSGTENEDNANQNYYDINKYKNSEPTYGVYVNSDYNISNSYEAPQSLSQNSKNTSDSGVGQYNNPAKEPEYMDPYNGPDSYNPPPIKNPYDAAITYVNMKENNKDSGQVNIEGTTINTQNTSDKGSGNYMSQSNASPNSHSDIRYHISYNPDWQSNQQLQDGKQSHDVEHSLGSYAYNIDLPQDTFHKHQQDNVKNEGQSYDKTSQQMSYNAQLSHDAPQNKDKDSYSMNTYRYPDPSAGNGMSYQAQKDSKVINHMQSEFTKGNYDTVQKNIYQAPGEPPGNHNEMYPRLKELYNTMTYKSPTKDTNMTSLKNNSPSKSTDIYGTSPGDSYKPASSYGDMYKKQQEVIYVTPTSNKDIFAEPPDSPQDHYGEEISNEDEDTSHFIIDHGSHDSYKTPYNDYGSHDSYKIPYNDYGSHDSYKTPYNGYHETAPESSHEFPEHTNYESIKFIHDEPPVSNLEYEQPFKYPHDKPPTMDDESTTTDEQPSKHHTNYESMKFIHDEPPVSNLEYEQPFKYTHDKPPMMDDDSTMTDEPPSKHHTNYESIKFIHDEPPVSNLEYEQQFKYPHDKPPTMDDESTMTDEPPSKHHTNYESIKFIHAEPPVSNLEYEQPFKYTHDKPPMMDDDSTMTDEPPYKHHTNYESIKFIHDEPPVSNLEYEQQFKYTHDKPPMMGNESTMTDEPPSKHMYDKPDESPMQYTNDEQSYEDIPNKIKFIYDKPFKYYHDQSPLEYDHHDHENQTEKYQIEYKTKERYVTYKIGQKLWLIPLYAGAIFIIYFLIVLLRSIARHKLLVPQFYLLNKDVWSSSRNINNITGNVMRALDTAEELYK